MSIDKKSTHYDEGGIETIEVIRAKLTPEQFEGFLLGNILKYSCRANFKGCFERDVEKIGVYKQLLYHHRKVSSKAEEKAEKEKPEAPPTVKNCDHCAHLLYGHISGKPTCEIKKDYIKLTDSCDNFKAQTLVITGDPRDEIGNVCHSCFHQGDKKTCSNCEPIGDLPTRFNRLADSTCRTCVDFNLINQQCERSLVLMKPLDWCRKHSNKNKVSRACGNCALHKHREFYCTEKEAQRSSNSYCSNWLMER